MAFSGLPAFSEGDRRISASGMKRLVSAVEDLDRRAQKPDERRTPYRMVTLRKASLTGYKLDDEGRAIAFRGFLVSGDGVLSPTGGSENELTFNVFRAPLDPLTECVPRLETYFSSTEPKHWVPVALFELCGSDEPDPPPPPPPRPNPQTPQPAPPPPPTQPPVTPTEIEESENPPWGTSLRGGSDPPPSDEPCGYAWYVLGWFIGTCAAEDPPPAPLLDRIAQLEATVAALAGKGASLGI